MNLMRSRYPFHSLIVYAEMNEPKRSSDLPCRESVIAFVVVLRKRERRGRQRLVPMPICETLAFSTTLYTASAQSQSCIVKGLL